MIIEKYNIKLKSLDENNLETVRQARNSKYIRDKMIYREEITPQQQYEWYKSLDPATNLYMIIEYNNLPCGLINIKSPSDKQYTSESGVFFWDEQILHGMVPILSSWLASEAGYLLLGGKQTLIRVLKSNKNAVVFNKSMGYNIVKEDENVFFMVQTKESFSKATLKNRLNYIKSNNVNSNLHLSFGKYEHDDFHEENLKKFMIVLNVTPIKKIDREYWFEVNF
jgi:hypothetical protein